MPFLRSQQYSPKIWVLNFHFAFSNMLNTTVSQALIRMPDCHDGIIAIISLTGLTYTTFIILLPEIVIPVILNQGARATWGSTRCLEGC